MTDAAVLRLLASLVLIVLMILAGAWLTRRAGWLRGSSQSPIRLLGSQSLGGRNYVAVVQVEDARLVVGVTAQQISLLHTLPPADPPTVEFSQPVTGSFANSLRQVLGNRA